jgi:ABC-type methionine transport system ATPase subunit
MSTNAGHLIIELTGSDEEIRKAIDYLKAHDVDVEVM